MKFEVLRQKVDAMPLDSIVEIIEEICEEQEEYELYHHMEYVAGVAAEISEHYHMDKDEAYLTGFLHDVGRLVDTEEYLDILNTYDIPYSSEETQVLDVLHGKVAHVIAKEIFKIESDNVCNGILYHTTLRKKPTDFEKIIFIADKMTWTYDDLIYRIEETVLQSLNVACYNALTWLIEHIEEKNGLVLDTTRDAYMYFKGTMLL